MRDVSFRPLIALGLCGLFMTVCLLVIAHKTEQLPISVVQEEPEPSLKFEVGDCVQYITKLESWEKAPAIWKIMEIGERNYKTCLVGTDSLNHCEEVLRDEAPASSIRFDSEEFYRKVSCGGL